jgi:hypothetical protein
VKYKNKQAIKNKQVCIFLYFTSVRNRLTYIVIYVTAERISIRSIFASGEVTSSLVNFGSNSMLLMPRGGPK